MFSPGCLTCPSRACLNFCPGTGKPGPSPRPHDHGPGDSSIIAFTPSGIENLRELIEMDRERAR
ncbi:MAG: hypothetical protein CMI51_14135 [Paracoccus sp.]|nr:hypothetical protein [Paracoccus sp. (in: a-proteobacteria)]